VKKKVVAERVACTPKKGAGQDPDGGFPGKNSNRQTHRDGAREYDKASCSFKQRIRAHSHPLLLLHLSSRVDEPEAEKMVLQKMKRHRLIALLAACTSMCILLVSFQVSCAS